MNEYTEFDTAAEMQKALNRKRRAYGYPESPESKERRRAFEVNRMVNDGVPYQPLTETCEVDPDTGIIVDRRTTIDTPCQSCGREESGKWFAPCPADDCPSHWEEQGVEHPDFPADEQRAMAVNSLLQLEEKVSFAPTEIAAFILAFFLFLALGIDTAMKGDMAAMRGMALAGVESGVGNER